MDWWMLAPALWIFSGGIAPFILDYRFGKGAGSDDEITWIVCIILGPFAVWMSLLPKP